MATTSVQSLPIGSPLQRSPSLKGLKKVLSSRRGSEALSDSATPVHHTSSDSLTLEKSPSLQSTRSPSRDDGSSKSGGSGVRKLIPGHTKRQRQKLREEELKIAVEEGARGRQPGPNQVGLPLESNSSVTSLFTDDSGGAESPPPLVSRDSHSGYLTMSSPLIKTTTIDGSSGEQSQVAASNPHNMSVEQFPLIVEPENHHAFSANGSISPRSPAMASSPALPSPGLIDKADTLRPDFRVERRSSFSRLRGKSPARKIRDVFSKGSKSPRTSPERKESALSTYDSHGLVRASTSMGERRSTENSENRAPSPLRAQTLKATDERSIKSAMPALETNLSPPKTPPSGIRDAPLTTVTPPTPTDVSRNTGAESPRPESEGRGSGDESFGLSSNPQGNTISHRRVQSASSATHTKSKLSTSMIAPLTPTVEEINSVVPSEKPPGSRNVTPGGGFFSSWVSAAQNAASTITNLTNQNSRGRSGTTASDPAQSKNVNETNKEVTIPSEAEPPKKQLAVETMGSGNLNLAHLGIGANADSLSTSQGTKGSNPIRDRDDAAAKMEDIMARRAVSQAYEKPAKSGEATPIAEVPDPMGGVKSSQTFDVAGSGSLTPPNGSIFEGETGVKRSNSVRSKIANRRSRGSSVTTGQSAVSTMIGASTLTLANPTAGPKLSGYAIAPKQRNRAFHQQFRSVPEDDYLIEDYSCALQKEILLAGRIYISEGHICFSSNILGWVTTLIISFEEVVSIEKENTALVIPNAIAVQTLHARHTFRSLLSREATFDLIIGIWKVSHPDSFQKSMNSKQVATSESKQDLTVRETETAGEPESESGSEEGSDADDDDDDDDGSAPSVVNSTFSAAGSEAVDVKSLSRKPSSGNGVGAVLTTAAPGASTGDAAASAAPTAASADVVPDYPGPATHAPTECTDKAAHYDKIIKDEIIPAPLGKMYSLLFGPQSGTFMRKFLEDGVSKAQDLQMEDDKKGLTLDSKTKHYKYIKPLGGSIGPKQTTCITTETLDCLDLEKAVSVTCSTQTPDVPSGSAFCTKTKYCISWAPGNATRFQMNMTIEWTAKSWLKGPIEKGALDGQTQYGDDLVKTLKGALGRTRALTTSSKTKGKKKRKGGRKEKSEEVKAEARKEEDWGLFQPLKPVLGPVADIVQPFAGTNLLIGVLTFMVFWMWFRGPGASRQVGFPWDSSSQRLVAYEQLWHQEENNLWDWLEERAGVDSAFLRQSTDVKRGQQKPGSRFRAQTFSAKEVGRNGMKEMQHAVQVTRERLDAMQEILDRQKPHPEHV